jgi:hypothetical protein
MNRVRSKSGKKFPTPANFITQPLVAPGTIWSVDLEYSLNISGPSLCYCDHIEPIPTHWLTGKLGNE